MDLKTSICLLLSMILVLASYQSLLYYKMLTDTFYNSILNFGKKKGARIVASHCCGYISELFKKKKKRQK